MVRRILLNVTVVIFLLLLPDDGLLAQRRDPLYGIPLVKPSKPATTTPPRARLTHDCRGLRHLAFSKDGKWLASTSWGDGVFQLWDVSTRKCIVRLGRTPGRRVSIPSWITAFAFSPDSKTVVASAHMGKDGPQIITYDIKAGKITRRFTPPKGGGAPFCFTPDGKTLILSSLSGAKLFDAATLKEIATLPGTGLPRRMAISSDGKHLAVANWDRSSNSTVIWDIEKRKLLFTLKELIFIPETLAFSPDGKELVADGIFYKLGDRAEVNYCLSLLNVTGGHPRGLAYSPDSKTIALVGFGPNLVLWDRVNKKLLCDFLGKTDGSGRAVAFSPDGRTVVTASENGDANDLLFFDLPVPKKVKKPAPVPKPCPPG